ncbi:hypothetical protein [Mycobacterium vicinigordonae]|nr:hypothetical protein [Mycobacterium vicinigordonae]
MGSIAAAIATPIAHADDSVTYEVVSDSVPILSGIEYRDASGRRLIRNVTLPWRLTAPVTDASSPADAGAELRADWRPSYRAFAFVTVRISFGGQVLCENTLDVGNATCYGNVPHRPA